VLVTAPVAEASGLPVVDEKALKLKMLSDLLSKQVCRVR
jgi:hypothetical protein